MARMVYLLLAGVMMVGLAACGGRTEDSFTVRIQCESEGLSQIFYSVYIDGEYRGMGGVADLDGGEIVPGRVFQLSFDPSWFQEGDDLSGFSLTLSPYGADDTQELGTTDPMTVPAEYGGDYTVVLSGDEKEGFSISSQESLPGESQS